LAADHNARTLRSRKCPLSAQGAISRKQSLTILAVCRHVDLCRSPFRTGGDLRETRRTSGIGLQTVSDVGVFFERRRHCIDALDCLIACNFNRHLTAAF
jgi:hypothetical protein